MLGQGGSPRPSDALDRQDQNRELRVANVEIYLRKSCPYCVRAMRLLDMKKVEPDVVDVEEQPGKRAEMVQRAGGRTTVPQIFIDGKHVGGCDELMDLEYDGKLDGLLAA